MPDYNFKNNLKSTLQAKLWSDATSIYCNHVVESEDADTRRNAWPAFPFTLTIVDTVNDHIEIIKCTSLASNSSDAIVFHCDRAQESTTAQTFEIATTRVEHRLTSEALNSITNAVSPATTTARGIGKVATLADMGPDAVIENGPAFLAAGSEAVTTTPTPNTIMCRDEAGRVRVEDPVHDKDVVNKVYVDSVINIGSNGAYGLKWNQEIDVYQKLGATNRTQIQKNMKRCVLNSDGTVNYYLDPFNSALKADGTTAILTGADGNIMVEVPKFWYKHELNGNEHQWWVSPTSLAGYNVHPWFLEGGVEHDFRYYRAYTCINQGSVLRSVSGVTPTRNQTRNTFRAQARANGAGWNLCSWNAVNAIQILFLTEYCTLNSQSVLGSGNDTGEDYGITTGQSNVIGKASSGPLNNNTWMSYRGIENFYADCWEFVDGINVQNYKVFLNQNPDTFADDMFTGDYEDSGVTVPAASANYVKKISGNFLPTALGGSSSTYVTDGFWSNTGNKIALFGGGAGYGAISGAFCLLVDNAASDVSVSVGAGLSR